MEKMKRKKLRVEISITVLVFGAVCLSIVGIVLGFLWGKQYTAAEEKMVQYGVAEQDLNIQSILWNDYPSYRELRFTVNGTISFHTKANGIITLQYPAEPDMLEETHREHKAFTGENGRQYYDKVTYSLHEGEVIVRLPKIYQNNTIQFLTDNSFYLTFWEEGSEYIAGCILVSDTVYMPWSAEEIENADINLNAYLSAFALSGTYDSTNPLHQKSANNEIRLTRENADGLTYSVQNNTSEDWNFEGQLPHIEFWYKGIWIEVLSPIDNNLLLRTIKTSETQQFEIPSETMKQYSTLFSGIYRLVLYGENGEYVVSEPFLYESME